eukprot:CAMPEP_0118657386 /NCGR_PEP_ID=MMETSP0785-20121206/13990_1 /TAXON_ID=91992 /ORGANISM="Bolidomonas pacifica, Strain CCMP 1866" /LENGTH=100 /DNA_ID=CAMNT_0006550299 /DNA_START=802 /DNA_END=1104 /DNA_ORIENTATION=-
MKGVVAVKVLQKYDRIDPLLQTSNDLGRVSAVPSVRWEWRIRWGGLETTGFILGLCVDGGGALEFSSWARSGTALALDKVTRALARGIECRRETVAAAHG